LGDAAGLPTAKTGAAVRKQVPVVVKNLLSVMDQKQPSEKYNGYSSCPLVTGYGKLVMAEFDYNNQPMETFPFDQSKERWSMYMLKRYILPWLYWNQILPGKM
jgi:sulfide:quinone oxidoreductase